MSAISSVNNTLIQSQLAQVQLQQEIAVRIAEKSQDMAETQGEMVLTLLEQVGDMARQSSSSLQASDSAAQITGLGQSVDVQV